MEVTNKIFRPNTSEAAEIQVEQKQENKSELIPSTSEFTLFGLSSRRFRSRLRDLGPGWRHLGTIRAVILGSASDFAWCGTGGQGPDRWISEPSTKRPTCSEVKFLDLRVIFSKETFVFSAASDLFGLQFSLRNSFSCQAHMHIHAARTQLLLCQI